MALADPKKVLIVDDSKMMRVLLARVVKSDASFEVAGRQKMVEPLLPGRNAIDLVLLDIETGHGRR